MSRRRGGYRKPFADPIPPSGETAESRHRRVARTQTATRAPDADLGCCSSAEPGIATSFKARFRMRLRILLTRLSRLIHRCDAAVDKSRLVAWLPPSL